MDLLDETHFRLPNEILFNIAAFLDLQDLMYQRNCIGIYESHYSVLKRELTRKLIRNITKDCDHQAVKSAIEKLNLLEFFVFLTIVSILDATRGRFKIDIINTLQNSRPNFSVLSSVKFGLKQWSIMLYCDVNMDNIEDVIQQCRFANKMITFDSFGRNVFDDTEQSTVFVHKTVYQTIHEDKLLSASPFTMISYRFQI